MKKHLSLVLILVLLVSALTGCSSAKTFTYQELTMEVPLGMVDASNREDTAAYNFALDSRKTAIFGLREEKSLFAEYDVTTLEQYAEVVLEANGLDALAIDRSTHDYKYFRFERQLEGGTYKYLAAVFASEEAFWVIQFAALVTNYDETAYFKYLDTVSFS